MAITRAFKNAVQQEQQIKPIVINGSMDIAQRGTSATGITADGLRTCDRWRTNIDSYGTYTLSQSTTVPTGEGFTNSFKIDCTTADASPGSGDLFTFEQRFEGQEVQMFKKGTSSAERYTVAFWIRSNLTGNFALNLVDSDNSRRVGSLVNIAQADTWEKKVISFPKDTTGAFDDDTADSFRIQFFLGVGSNFTSGTLPTSAWESATTANFAAGQSAFIGSNTDNELFITGLQLEMGTYDSETIPEFQFESHIDNLRRCQRYFHIGVGLDGNTTGFANGSFRTNATAQILHQFPVSMRTEPTATQIATDNIIAHDTADGNNINVDSIQSILFNCENNIVVQYTLEGTSAAAGDGCYVYPTGSTPGIKFEAEL